MLFFQFVAVNKLAAVYRGTLRALRVVIQQFSDHEKIPPYHKELFQMIHQLSLCSAQVEENGSAVPESTLQILQKLEVTLTKYSSASLPTSAFYLFK